MKHADSDLARPAGAAPPSKLGFPLPTSARIVSYDLHLYRSARGLPDADEAFALFEAQESETDQPVDAAGLITAETIVAAILSIDPTLERFQPPEPTAALPIELNTPDGDRDALQISVFADGVSVSIATGHRPKRARRIFARFDRCARAVHQAAGYFVFDPQCEQAWDPTQSAADPDAVYLPMQPVIERTLLTRPTAGATPAVEDVGAREAKPWWKLW